MALIKKDIFSSLSLYFSKLETFAKLVLRLIRELSENTVNTYRSRRREMYYKDRSR